MGLSRIARTFLSGLVVILPVIITAALLTWLVRAAGGALAPLWQVALPGVAYHAGYGLLAALALIFAIGVLMEALYFRRLIRWLESLLQRVPVIKTVYGTVRDMTQLVSRDQGNRANRVVRISVPGFQGQLLGLVTNENVNQSSLGLPDDAVAVYLPMSYQIGGYTVFLPRSALTPVNMSVEQAMRFIATAGVSGTAPGK